MKGESRLRAVLRLSVFAVGSWIPVLQGIRGVLSPTPRRWRLCAPYVSRWARLGTRCLGVTVRVKGSRPAPGSLVVANHQGYLDILVLGGLFPAVHSARHDMKSWPLFGWLASAGATIWINRQRKREGARGVAQVAQALADGASVCAFPEGTSTDGKGLLPFRTGVFQAAIDASAPVVPAAIRYLELDGEPITDETWHVVGWFNDAPFIAHVMALGRHHSVTAEVEFGAPLARPYGDRRRLAADGEAALRRLLGLPDGKLPEAAGAGVASPRAVESAQEAVS